MLKKPTAFNKFNFLKKDIVFLGIILFIFLSISFYLSNLKPIWFDELFTFHLAQLSFQEIFETLGAMDPHPPLHKFFTSISFSLFGASVFSTRLPNIIFYAVAILIIYFTCKKLYGKKAAVISSFLMLTCLGQVYAYEARPYSLVLMLTSILIYLRVHTPTRKKYIYLFIAITTAALVSSHYYAVFVPILILLTSFNSYKKKTIDWFLIISILIGLSILILYLPSIKKILILRENNWASPNKEYFFKAIKRIYYPFIFLLIPIVFSLKNSTNKLLYFLKNNTNISIVLSLISSLIFIGFAFSFALGAFHLRYFIASLIGCVILSSLIISNFNTKQLILSGILFFSLFSYRISKQITGLEILKHSIEQRLSSVNDLKKEVPIYIEPYKLYMSMNFYTNKSRKRNIYQIIKNSQKENCKGCTAGLISVFGISKINPTFQIATIDELKEKNTPFYFLTEKNNTKNPIDFGTVQTIKSKGGLLLKICYP
tara:strand:- start:6190 stop:7644 length:1455 start_codon:yes stop_codon:yes gene_type:complete